jgi:hypothetical protein
MRSIKKHAKGRLAPKKRLRLATPRLRRTLNGLMIFNLPPGSPQVTTELVKRLE